VPLLPGLDAVAPALALAQAIGRWGNYWNQELFGSPTTLPWALEIDPSHRPDGYEQYSTFHPTFLYESLWNFFLCGALLWIDRRWRIRPGRLFVMYVAGYTFMRFWIERVRIDPANKIVGLRVNEWVSGVLFLASVAFLVWDAVRHRHDAVLDEPVVGAVAAGDEDEADDDRSAAGEEDAVRVPDEAESATDDEVPDGDGE
jgi:prolipoprotein diacylglyceryl transferase